MILEESGPEGRGVELCPMCSARAPEAQTSTNALQTGLSEEPARKGKAEARMTLAA